MVGRKVVAGVWESVVGGKVVAVVAIVVRELVVIGRGVVSTVLFEITG